MARRKQNDPAGGGLAPQTPEPNGTGGAHAVLDPSEHPADKAARGRRTNGAARPRGRKVAAEAEIEVIAVQTKTSPAAGSTPQLQPGTQQTGEQFNELRRQSE